MSGVDGNIGPPFVQCCYLRRLISERYSFLGFQSGMTPLWIRYDLNTFEDLSVQSSAWLPVRLRTQARVPLSGQHGSAKLLDNASLEFDAFAASNSMLLIEPTSSPASERSRSSDGRPSDQANRHPRGFRVDTHRFTNFSTWMERAMARAIERSSKRSSERNLRKAEAIVKAVY